MQAKFIYVIIGICVLAVGATVYASYASKGTVPVVNLPVIKTQPTMSLTPASGNYKVGDTFDVSLNLNTGGLSTPGTQVNLTFDPTVLEVVDSNPDIQGTQIIPGAILTTVAGNLVKDNKIGFAGVAMPPSSFSGKGILATVKFKALKAGAANVNYDFTPGSRVGTVMSVDSENALKKVQNATYTIE